MLAVDDDGAVWNPFSAVRSPVVPLNDHVAPGATSELLMSWQSSLMLLMRCEAESGMVRSRGAP